MVKNDSLSSDLDLIKEVEELRLKQKLLVESLKQKQSGELQQALIEIHSKLDFLVKIFKEANSNSEDEDQESKLISLEEKFTTFEAQSKEQFEELKNSLTDISSLLSHLNKSPFPVDEKPIVNENSQVPTPSFKVEDKLETVSSLEKANQTPKKKKGWF